MKIVYPLLNPHTLSAKEIVQAFQTDHVKGITQSEAENRTTQFGGNIYEAQQQRTVWLILLLQFKSPIVYLLVAAGAVTFYFRYRSFVACLRPREGCRVDAR